MDMKILVAVKRVVDFNVRIRINKTATGVETEHVKMSINPFDEIALEEAVRLKEKSVAEEVIAVSIGSLASKEVLSHALALGADRAILVEVEKPEALEPFHVAQLLKKIALAENIGLILLGKQAIDDDCNQTGQMLAGLLGWAQGTFASELMVSPPTVNITREIDGGLETLQLKLPAVITTDLRLNQPRFPNMVNIMKAKTKPLLKIAAETLNVDFKPHVELLDLAAPEARLSGKKLNNIKEIFEILQLQKGNS
jgi:electron transfer flavoprotein beta subunit